MIRVALFVSSAVHRTGLETLLQGAGDIEVSMSTDRLGAPRVDPGMVDVIILDGPNLFDEKTEGLLAFYDPVAVLALTGAAEAVGRVSRLPVEAWGVLHTDAAPEEIFSALQALAEGLVAAAPDLLKPSLARLVLQQGGAMEPLVDSLTEREGEVLELLARGMPNKQIAQELLISEHTVKFHVSSICGKLGAANRTEAVREGLRRGLVSL